MRSLRKALFWTSSADKTSTHRRKTHFSVLPLAQSYSVSWRHQSWLDVVLNKWPTQSLFPFAKVQQKRASDQRKTTTLVGQYPSTQMMKMQKKQFIQCPQGTVQRNSRKSVKHDKKALMLSKEARNVSPATVKCALSNCPCGHLRLVGVWSEALIELNACIALQYLRAIGHVTDDFRCNNAVLLSISNCTHQDCPSYARMVALWCCEKRAHHLRFVHSPLQERNSFWKPSN